MMPGLLHGDLVPRRSDDLGVVEGHVGDDGDGAVGHVGGVPTPAHADLEHDHVDGDVGEPPEGGGRRAARNGSGGRRGCSSYGRRPSSRSAREASSIDSPFKSHALVDALKVGAGVRTDRQAVGGEESRHHAGRRTLAVGPGEMHHRAGGLGVAEQAAELDHPVEGRARPPRRRRLEVHVGLEIGQRVGERGRFEGGHRRTVYLSSRAVYLPRGVSRRARTPPNREEPRT